MKLTCPSCHTIFHLEAAMEEAAGREFTAFVAELGPLARPLVAYLGLFRPASRALAYERMLRLAREVVELSSDNLQLSTALSETVEAIRKKRAEGKNQPLKNHNYLKQVIESTPGSTFNVQGSRSCPAANQDTSSAAAGSKTTGAMAALEEWAGGEWLRTGIAAGLAACLAQHLRSRPAADVVTMTADTWYLALSPVFTIQEIDAPRLVRGFELLLPQLTEWPAPKDLLALAPPRPKRVKLPEPEISEEQRVANLARVKELMDRFV